MKNERDKAETTSREQTSAKRELRRPYSTPRLECFGTLSDIMKNVGNKGNKDNGSMSKQRTE